MIFNVRKNILYFCICHLAAFALKCYVGGKETTELGVQEQFVEANCPPSADSCMKDYVKHGKTEVIVKICAPKLIREARQMRKDECLHNAAQICKKVLSSRTSPIESPTNFTLPNIAIGRNAMVKQCKANADMTGVEAAACHCSTDLCNSASNLSPWVISILVTICIFFVI